MSAPKVLENTSRRDALIAVEKRYQKQWAEERAFEVNAPTTEEVAFGTSVDELHLEHPKYFGTMAYPYMNGVLHAGHGFTLSKVEFAAGFQRMLGKRTLFPLGFHCTGMPIKALADKIAREVEQFGPLFENVPADEPEETPVAAAPAEKTDPTKFKAKKSKVQAKQGRGKYQFEIMMQLGLAREEVAAFADANHWLYHFPALCQLDVSAFGGRVDWRRSFITTDVNPYYDLFVLWQITRLREIGKIKFGERYTVYSEKDGQPCLDHDRASGEGVTPQEYVGIKILVTEFPQEALDVLATCDFDPTGHKVYLVAATLRPETMFGQTTCFVLPKIDYGVFEAAPGVYYITTERAFKNMLYQKLTPQRGVYAPTARINGKALIGAKIKAPLVDRELRVLPMETVLAAKGTGVVTCVPLDLPDDFITTKELALKPEYYGIQKEWVVTDILPIIHTEKYGDKCAEFLCNELKIQLPKDLVQLAKAKELAYKAGFYEGTMIAGPYKGMKVEEAKLKTKADLIASGDAFVYDEPELLVISRSGDECIVLLEDQWYVDYGEPEWRLLATECLESMQTFLPETKHGFEGVLAWLKLWAVLRTYGLGTKVPWDHGLLVESLSDLTIYMAYYTVCHMLHSDFYGKELGTLNIKPEDLSLEMWDYVFCRRDTVESKIPLEKLQAMRREFEYFYPLDIRVLGKDLIPNHLTFFIYTHTALFPKRLWPRGVRANGHLLLNNAKMLKSTGNFMTLRDIIEKYGADAARITLADGGDTVEDANFEELNANAAILRLFTLKEWCEEMLASTLREEDAEVDATAKFFDEAFANEMNGLIEETYAAFCDSQWKAGLKTGLFDFQASRDFYRDVMLKHGMRKDLVLRYISTQALMLAPIAPHFAEYVHRDLLGNKTLVHATLFPRASAPVDKLVSDALAYVREVARGIREAEAQALKKKKGKPVEIDAKAPLQLTILVLPQFPDWQDQYIELVRELFEQHKLDDNKVIKEKVGKDMQRAMPFINLLKQRLAVEQPDVVFNRQLTFDEVKTAQLTAPVLVTAPAQINVTEARVVVLSAAGAKDAVTGEPVEVKASAKVLADAVPGAPGFVFANL